MILADHIASLEQARAGKDPKTRSEEAYRRIKQLIFDQKLVPGQKLIYDDLARLLHMSRTPLINALNRLEQQGLVVSESHRGFYVRPMDLQEAWESFGLREALELYSVQQAVLKATEEDIERLDLSAARYDEYKPHYFDRRKLSLDAAFHLQIAQTAKNRILKWHLKINFDHLYLRAKLDDMDMGLTEKESGSHRLLVKKIRDRDAAGAVRLIKEHIEVLRQSVMTCLSDNETRTAGV
ncbi:MAG: GntR family transcriptional regulator [Deltaproteobacteria bacterium]|jgi:DNA-binding GntR family transcriptional regulator|nr:GntR family transcriptional regulator [Deltaproteobacteria bacterium]